MSGNRINRSDLELKQALIDHLDILRDALEKVGSGDEKYVKIIFSELRILVINSGQNKALLLGIAKKYNIIPNVYINSPFGKKILSLEDHLKEIYFVSNTEGIRLTNADFIIKHSQQEGGAHEDWSLENEILFPNQ